MRICNWWTRERVVAGLRRFYRDRGVVPTSSSVYLGMVRCRLTGSHRRYPSHVAVLRYFRTFRQAWQAAGVILDRSHEEWTELEDWYLREAAGIIPRKEIARDLRRSSDAVHRRLYDLCLHSYRVHGLSANRVSQLAGLYGESVYRYVTGGVLPAYRGSKSYFINPIDLLRLDLDWSRGELQAVVRQALVQRMVNILI